MVLEQLSDDFAVSTRTKISVRLNKMESAVFNL